MQLSRWTGRAALACLPLLVACSAAVPVEPEGASLADAGPATGDPAAPPGRLHAPYDAGADPSRIDAGLPANPPARDAGRDATLADAGTDASSNAVDAASDASSSDASADASTVDAGPTRSGWVVAHSVSYRENNTRPVTETWAATALTTGAIVAPAACTTIAAGACTLTDCPDVFETRATAVSAGRVAVQGAGGSTRPLMDWKSWGVYETFYEREYDSWSYGAGIRGAVTVSAPGAAAHPPIQASSQAPLYVAFSAPWVSTRSTPPAMYPRTGEDLTFTWSGGRAGDRFVAAFSQSSAHTLPLPTIVRLDCPATAGTGTVPSAWITKLGALSNWSVYTETRTTVDVAGSPFVVSLRQGAGTTPTGYASVNGCTRQCTGKTCGDDGCGGQCGTCTGGDVCNARDQCAPPCVASCSGRSCGDDGCGGSCGTCTGATTCSSAGACVATGCNPVSNSGCASGEGCWVLSGERTACSVTGSGTQGRSCATTGDCAGGHGCFAGTCRKICNVGSGSGCSGASTCTRISGWSTYGACGP